MKCRRPLNVVLAIALAVGAAQAGPKVTATADVDGDALEPLFEAGDALSVPLQVPSRMYSDLRSRIRGGGFCG